MKNLSEPDASASRTLPRIDNTRVQAAQRAPASTPEQTGEPPAGMKAGLHSSIVLDGLSIEIILSTVSYHYPVTM